jgi:hypothetical protein
MGWGLTIGNGQSHGQSDPAQLISRKQRRGVQIGQLESISDV